ncbi:MAG: hypothetical protein M3R15_30795 [Acidobacteriota bacterium]|nr:hypothetical protein [Acidobacteriota bacterium]
MPWTRTAHAETMKNFGGDKSSTTDCYFLSFMQPAAGRPQASSYFPHAA